MTIKKSTPTRLLLIGFGRMGVTHLSIISGLLYPKPLEVYIVDPSFVSRFLAKELYTSVNVFRKLTDVRRKYSENFFDICIVSTPPLGRVEIMGDVKYLARKVFIEKPLIVKLEDNQMSGYVLQHAPLNKDVFALMAKESIVRVNAVLTTNISFANLKNGWRSGKFGSVLYEFGGHLLTLIAATCGDKEFLSKEYSLNSITSAAVEADHVEFEISSGNTIFNIELIAGSERVRKASYNIEYITQDNCYAYDLYSLTSRSLIESKDENVILNIADRDSKVNFYVRGFEFTLQMQAFLDGTMDTLTQDQLNNIEQIVEGVI